MRAKTVNIRKVYVFDWDDTLVQTDAKVYVTKNGKRIKSLTPPEFNFYKFKPGEKKDVSDFIDPRIILNAKKYKMWPALENINNAKKMGRSTSDIYILTARSEKAKLPIYTFLKRNGIDISLDNIFAIGQDKEDARDDIPERKKEILRELTNEYDEVYFFDDSEKNINLANKVPGIKTRLVDWNK